jgi:hypothetical protein
LRTKKWTRSERRLRDVGEEPEQERANDREVFDAEKFDDEAKSTKAAHATTGP